jgi:hypothetical protein
MAPASGEGVKEQLANENSLLRYYVKVGNLKLRYPWIAYGDIEGLNNWDSHVAAYRVFNPDTNAAVKSVVIAHNTDYATPHGVTLPNASEYWGFAVKKSWESAGWEGRGPYNGSNFDLPGYSTVVFEER